MVILIMEARMRDVRSRSMIKLWRAYWLAGIVRHAAARRHRHHQPFTDNPGGLGAQSADGDVAGQARHLVVGTETRGRGHLCLAATFMRRRWPIIFAVSVSGLAVLGNISHF